MSADQHEVEMEVLIVVKAYPTPSQKYNESVCVAGLRLNTQTPEWVRLYPVAYRDLPGHQHFKKYDIVRLRARRRSQDPRPESYAPNLDTLTVVGHVGHENGWAARKPYIEAARISSMCELQRRERQQGTSLGVFRPAVISGFEITPTSSDWDEQRQGLLGQGNLFCEVQKRPLEKIPFEFRYVYRCDDPACGGHRMSMIDWELGESFRKTAGLPDDERLKLVHQRWFERVCGPKRDTDFFAGNLARHPHTFVLLGAFWPPKQAQRKVPDGQQTFALA